MLPFLSESDVFIVIRMLYYDFIYLSMFLFLLPSNIEQMCLKVLLQVPGEIKKTGTDELDLLSSFLPSTPLPLEDTSSAALDNREKNAVLPEESDMKNTEMPTAIIHFQ